jgi:hypothetical protein
VIEQITIGDVLLADDERDGAAAALLPRPASPPRSRGCRTRLSAPSGSQRLGGWTT